MPRQQIEVQARRNELQKGRIQLQTELHCQQDKVNCKGD